MAVRVCLRVFLLFIPACHLEAGQSGKKERQGKEKSKHHLYVKAHLSCGEKHVQMGATCIRMSFKNSIKQYVGLYLNNYVCVDVYSLKNG